MCLLCTVPVLTCAGVTIIILTNCNIRNIINISVTREEGTVNL